MKTNNKAVKDAAQIIYGEVMQIIDTHVIHENPAKEPRIDPSCLEALCCELDEHFTEKYGVDTQRKPLNAYTWDEIKAIADAGKAADVFKVGDEKQLALYTGETVTLVILGFNHDNKADGSGKAAITFGAKDLIDGEYEMNEITTDDEDDYGSNVGGWCKSKMRNVYMRRLFTLLPPDLQNVITPVEKMTGAGGGSNELYKRRAVRCQRRGRAIRLLQRPRQHRQVAPRSYGLVVVALALRRFYVYLYLRQLDGDCRQLLREPLVRRVLRLLHLIDNQ